MEDPQPEVDVYRGLEIAAEFVSMPDVALHESPNWVTMDEAKSPRPTRGRPRKRVGDSPAGRVEAKPIETEYAGHRFRSRLEARWAVFFDALGLAWEYEPQGYELSTGVRYLPDFWLPAIGMWVEVKAVMSLPDWKKTIRAALELPVPDPEALTPRLAVLGAVPTPTGTSLHSCLSVLDEFIIWTRGFFAEPDWQVKPFGAPIHWFPWWFDDKSDGAGTEDRRAQMVETRPEPNLKAARPLIAAYRAARAARFEHGESGLPAPPRPSPTREPIPLPADLYRGQVSVNSTPYPEAIKRPAKSKVRSSSRGSSTELSSENGTSSG